jgi:hypothetical protein
MACSTSWKKRPINPRVFARAADIELGAPRRAAACAVCKARAHARVGAFVAELVAVDRR